MANMDIPATLEQYGLSKNEVLVYLAALKVGEATANEIALTAKLARTTTYHLLRSLEQKGIIGHVIVSDVTYFHAADPKELLNKLDEKRELISRAIPQLIKLQKTVGPRPQVTMFEGIAGVKTVLKKTLEKQKTIYHYGNLKSLQKILPFAFPNYITQRVKKKIPIKIICKKKLEHKKLIDSATEQLREFSFVKGGKFESNVFLFNEKVAILHLETEPYHAVLIESKEFYKSQKVFFELLWESLT